MKNVLNIFRNTKKNYPGILRFFSSLFYDTRLVNHYSDKMVHFYQYIFSEITNMSMYMWYRISFFRFSFFRQYLMKNSHIATIKKLKTKTKIKKIWYHMYIDIFVISRKIYICKSVPFCRNPAWEMVIYQSCVIKK